jgi:hypothetical protein
MKYKEPLITIHPDELMPSEDYFESKSLKHAVWQYLMDHAFLTGKSWRVIFHITEPEEFWKRVNARKNGLFKREDLLDLRRQEEAMGWRVKRALEIVGNNPEKVANLIKNQAAKDQWALDVNNARVNGTFLQKLGLPIIRHLKKGTNHLETWLVQRVK